MANIRLLVCALIASLAGCSAPVALQPDARATEWIPGSAMHGVHGLAFGPDGALYGASLTGYSVYRIDVATGAVTTAVAPPQGNADDVAFGPDGTLVWTAGAFGKVFARTPAGEIRTLAENLPGVNSVNFSPGGRLFLTRVFAGDALYELDPAGVKPPRLIADKLGGLNGFEVTADGKLYGPLFFRRKIVQVDIETGAVSDFADGFTVPAAVNIDHRGNLYAVDIQTGEVTRIRLADRSRTVLAKLDPPLDNLAIDKRGWVYVSNPALNRITEINPDTGATRVVVSGRLSSPGGIAIGTADGREALFIADFWGNQFADTATGTMHRWERPTGVPSSANVAIGDESYALSSIWPIGAVFVASRTTNKTIKTVPLGAPYGIAYLPDGSLVVADYKNNALVRLAAGDSRDKAAVTTALNGPVGVAAAGTDAVYVSEHGAGTVARIALAGGARTVIASNIEQPEGLAVDSDGALIVAETGRQRVLRIDPASGATSVLGSDIPMGLAAGPDLPAPFLMTGVAIGADGSIYVSADVTNAVYRIRR